MNFLMQPENKPIGHWVRQLDELLTQGINTIQASFNLTRTEWQVLNMLAHHAMGSGELLHGMQPFADEQAVTKIISGFKKENLLQTGPDDALGLSEQGRQLHGRCLEQQQAFRKKAMDGIPPQDYITTMLTLRKIVENISRPNE